MKRYDLVVLGDLVADVIIPVERLPLVAGFQGWAEGIFVEPGGAGNVLVGARRLNLRTATLGTIGSDNYGRDMLQMLADCGVITDYVAICPSRQTILCVVLADKLGQHLFLGIKDNFGTWPFVHSWHAVISESRALFTDGYTVRDVLDCSDLLAALATAHRATVDVFFDPGPSIPFIDPALLSKVLRASNVLLVTELEATLLYAALKCTQQLSAILEMGPRVVVLKRGAAGCTIATATGTIDVSPFDVTVQDTVGAGDAFAAAFIAGWLRGGALTQCGTLANAMGALTSTKRGAGTRIPRSDELHTMLGHMPNIRVLIG